MYGVASCCTVAPTACVSTHTHHATRPAPSPRRVADPKEQIRALVGSCLAAARLHHTADAVVAALARSLQANRAPKVKCAVMAFLAAAARGGDAGEACAPAPPLLQQLAGSGSALAGLLRSLLQLSVDKNPDIRRAAAEAVAAAYHGGEAAAVAAAVQALPPADSLAVQRAIAPALKQGGNGEMPPPPPRPSSKAGSRRHSGEGVKQQQQAVRRPESSGSLTSRSQQGSQSGSPPHSQAPAAAAAAAAAAGPQLTPEPPSPFMWRSESASPLPGSDQQPAAAEAAAQQQDFATVPTPPRAAMAADAASPVALQAAADLAPLDEVMAAQLERLVGQLGQGPSCEALQGLSRLAHVLPAAAWGPCFEQVG